MYIKRRNLYWILAGFSLVLIVLATLAAVHLPSIYPAWIATFWEPEFDYLPDYTKGPGISASSAILLEGTTGTVLYAKNEHIRRPPASTTKILTALLALEEGTLGDVVTISQRAASVRGSSARIYPRQRIPLTDLIHGLLLPSGNDAAVAIAEHLAGSEAEFVKNMNLRARELGALNSHFANPHGLDHPDHYSTAFDLAMITRVAMLYPQFGEAVSKTKHDASFDGSRWSWYNTNRLLISFEGAEGVKTGTTGGAGYCLVAAASRDGRRLISVVLNSRNRWNDAANLLEYGFQQFHLLPLSQKGQKLADITIQGGVHQRVAGIAKDTTYKVVPNRDIDAVRAEVVIEKTNAPIKRGQRLGEVLYMLGDDVIGKTPLVASDSVPRATPLNRLLYWLQRHFTTSPKEYIQPEIS
ncbi:MAG: D-alanyl-D-alanine carboxypeptidase [Firmicutes bacterium]|jgi:D-alanyl-D-alanine carboxypeptidase (penicillin-binding protein 5/6)|nr:D-alanyl-D-alanine carboxypeptidase [Bacillota bacterium]